MEDRLNEAKRHLSDIFAKIESVHDAINENNRATSYLFCLFDLFKIDENSISKVLTFLLDPNGTHGQGNVYLNEFCKELKISCPTKNDVWIQREFRTENGTLCANIAETPALF